MVTGMDYLYTNSITFDLKAYKVVLSAPLVSDPEKTIQAQLSVVAHDRDEAVELVRAYYKDEMPKYDWDNLKNENTEPLMVCMPAFSSRPAEGSDNAG
jgi:hypothetical protein